MCLAQQALISLPPKRGCYLFLIHICGDHVVLVYLCCISTEGCYLFLIHMCEDHVVFVYLYCICTEGVLSFPHSYMWGSCSICVFVLYLYRVFVQHLVCSGSLELIFLPTCHKGHHDHLHRLMSMHFRTPLSLNPLTPSPTLTLCHIQYNKVEVLQMHFYSFLLNDMVSTMILECCDSTLLRNTYWTLPENSHPTWEVKRPNNFKKLRSSWDTLVPQAHFEGFLFREHMEMGNTFKIWVPRPLCIQDLTHPTSRQNFDTSGKIIILVSS